MKNRLKITFYLLATLFCLGSSISSVAVHEMYCGMESIPLQELLLPWTPYSGLVISDRARQERAVMHHVKFIHRFSEGHGKVLRPVKMENGGTTVRVRCPNGEKFVAKLLEFNK